MKRKGNLYDNMCDINNIMLVYDEVCRNTKNKKRVATYREYRCGNIAKIRDVLINRRYVVGPYNVFTIYEPKERRIVSQKMFDKVINHLVARYILMPALFPSLVPENVASRKNLGTKAGLNLAMKFENKCKAKYNKYFVLKCDISKFFASIDHDILKEKLKRKIKDKDALKIVFDVIDSEENGLGIGNMTSQILAIFYLNDLDHYIKERLGIKYYVRYQDDFMIYHNSKKYLNYCLKKITEYITKEKLVLNTKTRIYASRDNYIYLGKNKNRSYAKYRSVKRKLKKAYYLYNVGNIQLKNMLMVMQSYDYLLGN